jgi:hypothetical protein
MLYKIVLAILFSSSLSLYAAIEDGEHFSKTFNQTRKYRVFLPASYEEDKTSRYPVIYYCHGMGGRYAWDAYDKDSLGNYPNVSEFLEFTQKNDALIVCVDGYIGIPSKEYREGILYKTRPYYDQIQSNYRYQKYMEQGKGYRFAHYIRELIFHIDTTYRTKAMPQYRAVSGLSMGGHSALFMSANNPHLFKSVSGFCHSTAMNAVGLQPYRTSVLVYDLWRNFDNVSVRISTNTMDYLSFYIRHLKEFYRSTGLDCDFHVAEFWRHFAVDIDSQFLYHLETFKTEKVKPSNFSHVNLYPEFDFWGYAVKTNKAEPGWTVFENVNRSGFNVHSTQHFRFRVPISNYKVIVKTPGIYRKKTKYLVTDYDFNKGKIKKRKIKTDKAGRLKIKTSSGLGHAIGIVESGKQAIVTPWPFEFNTTLFIEEGRDTSLPLILVNKGNKKADKISVQVSTLTPWINVLKPVVTVKSIASGKAVTLKDCIKLNVRHETDIPVGAVIIKVMTDDNPMGEILKVPVHAMRSPIPTIEHENIIIADGRSLVLKNFAGRRFNGEGRVLDINVQAGTGNGNGIPEQGEKIVIFVRDSVGIVPQDTNSHHLVYYVAPVKGLKQGELYTYKYPKDVDNRYNRTQVPLGSIIEILPDFKPGARLLTVRRLEKTTIMEGSRNNVDEFRCRYGIIELK